MSRRSTSDTIISFLGIALIFALCVWAVACEVGVWRECRADHSWFYCSRVLGHS